MTKSISVVIGWILIVLLAIYGIIIFLRFALEGFPVFGAGQATVYLVIAAIIYWYVIFRKKKTQG
ncbi:hypothetical protein IIA15_11985 [candidate division TA06 bacterium]|nr:hypothetical protein [candidate division TA06 bacterium]